jgi:hypothetical protein
MKTKPAIYSASALLLILAALFLASGKPGNKGVAKQGRISDQKTETIQLFNGKDLSNWVFYLRDQAVDPSTVFTVKGGVIHITGNPYGYMRTKESYSDYTLHLEWRWPVEATNSGVFINAQPPDTIWIRCFECQLAAGNAGDLICMNGSDMNERKDKTGRVVRKLADSSEKPTGEWNTLEVTNSDNTLVVRVNGVLQNKGTGLSANSGCICLQSEGKDVEFRNVTLTKL